MGKASLKEELQSAARAVVPTSTNRRQALIKMLRGVDSTGTTISVVDSITAHEAQIEAIEKMSISEMYLEMDDAMIEAIRIMRKIMESGAEETNDRIGAVKALGVIGGYVNKRRESTKEGGKIGNQINVLIDNNMQSPSVPTVIMDDYHDRSGE